jgi:hypothetical protein
MNTPKGDTLNELLERAIQEIREIQVGPTSSMVGQDVTKTIYQLCALARVCNDAIPMLVMYHMERV